MIINRNILLQYVKYPQSTNLSSFGCVLRSCFSRSSLFIYKIKHRKAKLMESIVMLSHTHTHTHTHTHIINSLTVIVNKSTRCQKDRNKMNMICEPGLHRFSGSVYELVKFINKKLYWLYILQSPEYNVHIWTRCKALVPKMGRDASWDVGSCCY